MLDRYECWYAPANSGEKSGECAPANSGESECAENAHQP